MIVTWMAWAALFTAIAALAALGGERLLAIWRMPRRGVWVLAMAASLVVPAALAMRRAPAAHASPERIGAAATTSQDQIDERIAIAVSATHSRIDVARIVLVAWIAASVAMLAVIGVSFIVVRRAAGRWPIAEVDGHLVRVAPSAGPAVVGAIRPTIVLPAWAIELAAGERALMLRHESEHVRAGDPRLLLAAAVCTALMRWNAALWFIARRLRLAIEIDCDARVLRGAPQTHQYGLLLLTVGARRGASLPLAASLVERRPLIERRIVAMTSRRPSRPVLASLPAIALVLAAGVLVAQTPQPAPLRAATPTAPPAASTPATPAAPAAPLESIQPAQSTPTPPAPAQQPAPRPRPISPDSKLSRSSAAKFEPIPNATIRRWIEVMQPGLLNGDTSNAIIFVLAANGDVVHSEVGYDRGLNDRLATIAAKQAAGGMMSRARVQGDSVIIDSMRTMKAEGMMRGRISGSGTVTVMTPEGRGSGRGVAAVTTEGIQFHDGMSNMFPHLEIPSNQIEQVEVRNTNSTVLDRPLEVVIIWLK